MTNNIKDVKQTLKDIRERIIEIKENGAIEYHYIGIQDWDTLQEIAERNGLGGLHERPDFNDVYADYLLRPEWTLQYITELEDNLIEMYEEQEQE